WDDAEGIVGHRAHGGVADGFQCRAGADDVGKAGDPDQAHGHANRYAQQHQREQREKPNDGDGIGSHRSHATGLLGSAGVSRASFSGWKTRRYVRMAMSRTADTSPAHAM